MHVPLKQLPPALATGRASSSSLTQGAESSNQPLEAPSARETTAVNMRQEEEVMQQVPKHPPKTKGGKKKVCAPAWGGTTGPSMEG